MMLGTDFERLGATVADRVGASGKHRAAAKGAARGVVPKAPPVSAEDHHRFANNQLMAIAASLGGQWEKQDRSGVVVKYSHLADTGFTSSRLGIKGSGVVLVGYTIREPPFRFYILDDDPMTPDQTELLRGRKFKSSYQVLRAQTPKVSGVVDIPRPEDIPLVSDTVAVW